MSQKTFSHLTAVRRIPTDYEVATTALLYYPKLGFEIESPLIAWFRARQRGDGSQGLEMSDWDQFADPRGTTYARYVTIQRDKEAFVEGLWRFAATTGHDAGLSACWLTELEGVLPTLRFPLHGLQMAAAYVGHLAPGGRVVCAAAFQAADEMRRITGIARRMHALKKLKPDFGSASRETWEQDLTWQPLRELIERLLVTYDFAEALTALCFVVKPRFDRLFFDEWAKKAWRQGDDVLAKVLFSWREDGAWHEEWTHALSETLRDADPRNGGLLARHAEIWAERTERALAPLREKMLS